MVFLVGTEPLALHVALQLVHDDLSQPLIVRFSLVQPVGGLYRPYL